MAERLLTLSSYGHAPTDVTATLTEYDRGARIKRAATIGLPLLGGALLSLPFPGWHLFAVPGFLIAAVVFALRRLREQASVEALDGACPACRQPQGFPPPAVFELPHTLRCPGCAEFLKLETGARESSVPAPPGVR